MNFIKVGARYINLDNVTNIGPVNKEYAGKDGILQIEYIGRNSEDWGSEWVEGHEAQALVSWLESIATDVVAVFEGDILVAEYATQATARNCATCGGDGCAECDPPARPLPMDGTDYHEYGEE